MSDDVQMVMVDPTAHRGLEALAYTIASMSGFCRDEEGFGSMPNEAKHGCRELALRYMNVLGAHAPVPTLVLEPDAIRMWLTPEARHLYPDQDTAGED